MSDIEKHDEEMNTEDRLVAGLTLFIRTLFEDWAKSFKQEMFELIDNVVKESETIGDLQHQVDEMEKIVVTTEQLETTISNIEVGEGMTEEDWETIREVQNKQERFEHAFKALGEYFTQFS